MEYRVLNVGGYSKTIPIPDHYASFEHVLLDIDPAGKPDILLDALKMTTLPAGEFDAIWCSHNLEHFREHEVPKLLKGFLHVLKPDGFAEIAVPDLDHLFREYVEKGYELDQMLYVSSAGPVRVKDIIYGYAPTIARSGQDFYQHRTGFTAKTITKELTRAGFHQIIRRPGRHYELRVIAFRAEPSDEQRKLLKLRVAPA